MSFAYNVYIPPSFYAVQYCLRPYRVGLLFTLKAGCRNWLRDSFYANCRQEKKERRQFSGKQRYTASAKRKTAAQKSRFSVERTACERLQLSMCLFPDLAFCWRRRRRIVKLSVHWKWYCKTKHFQNSFETVSFQSRFNVCGPFENCTRKYQECSLTLCQIGVI